MSELRILMVIESLGRGGAEQALVNLVPALRARGLACDVATLHGPDDLAGDLERAGAAVHRLEIGHRWNLAAGVPRLARLCRRGGYHVVHAHLFFPGVYTALSRPFAPGPRRVVTFHNLGYESYPADTAWRKVRKRLDAFLMRNAIDGRVAVSTAVGRHYARHLGLPPMESFPNAFPVEALRPDAGLDRGAVLAPFGLDGDDRVLLFSGRMVHEKGHRFFLRALEILRGRGQVPRALIVGSGPKAGEVAAQVRALGLDDQVRIHEALPHQDVLRLVQAADLYVMASTHEGFPLGPAEAMALEKPVLATRVGGLPDLIVDGESGVLLPPAEPEALASEIARLLGDPALRQRLGRAGRRRIVEHFSTDVLAARWDNYYRSLIDGRPASVAVAGGTSPALPGGLS